MFLGAFAKLRKVIISVVCPFVRPSFRLSVRNNSVPSGRIFIEFYIRIFFENLPRKFQVSLKSDKKISSFIKIGQENFKFH
jgi:hypothetical protein